MADEKRHQEPTVNPEDSGQTEEQINEQEVEEMKETETPIDETEQLLQEKDQTIKKLEETIEQLNQEIEQIKRAAADLKNRNRQYEIDRKYAESGLVKNLLVPLSYFEGALSVKTEDQNLLNFLKGFEMIYNLIFEQLYQSGLKVIEAKENQPFDPKIHEVFELVDSEESDGVIVSIVQKGYYFKDRVIKPAQVRVTRLVTAEEAEELNEQEVQKTEEIVH